MKKIWIHELEYAGETAAEKLARVREKMQRSGVSSIDLNEEDDVAWLTNLRGSGFADRYTPSFTGKMRVEMERAFLYTDLSLLTEEIRVHLTAAGIEAKPYEEAPGSIFDVKCYKTPSEIAHMKASHLRDGVIVTRFIRLLKERMAAGVHTDELDVVRILDGMRAEDPNYVGLSFPTIGGYGPNGAVIHYTADEKSNTVLEPHGLLVLDSGGQYLDGTTDITRTIALGPVNDEEKLHYTLVLQGMLRLMNTSFPADPEARRQLTLEHMGTKADGREYRFGEYLDTIARKPLRDHGLDYNHGTGHGVGYLGRVHELPVRIPEADFQPGLVMSDEPGVYLEGSHGVRIENLILCRPAAEEGMLGFEPLTAAPLEPDAVDVSIMTAEDLQMYNDYQQQVWEKLSGLLEAEDREWLKHETRILG